MNIVRLLRRQANITQTELAARAGTSQPTVAAYESGAKSPTLRTLQQIAAALGFELFFSFQRPMTREDRRSLAFHEAIVDALRRNPRDCIQRALQNLAHLTRLHPHAGSLLSHWSEWLDLSIEELIPRLLDPGMSAREMRQVSPFSGILDVRTRTRVLKQFRKDYQS